MKRLLIISTIVALFTMTQAASLRAEHEHSDGYVDTAQRITPVELKARMDKGENIVIFDVRAREARGETKIKGAVTMPLNELEHRVSEIPFGALVAAYCT